MHFTPAVLFLTVLLLAPSATAGTIYKCKSPAGALLYQEKPCTEEAKSVSSWSVSTDAKVSEEGGAAAPLIIGQGNNGHYFVDGSINDHFLSFVVDTGASVVTIPQGVASTAGLRCMGQATMHTGNGVSQVCTTVIQKLRFGNFMLSDVDAIIAPNLGQPLLGMNVLKRFRVEQDAGQMKLSKKY